MIPPAMLIFLTDRKTAGLELTRRLNDAGLTVLTERTVAAEYLCRERTMGALLIDGIPDPTAANTLCARMRDEYPELPIALILGADAVADTVADCVIRAESATGIAQEVLEFCRAHGWTPELSTFALLLTADPADTRLLGYRMPLSPREHQVLRLIYLRAPETVSRNELLAVCLPEGLQRAENLTVHVNHINTKAKSITGLPLIESVYGKGYRLRAGIVHMNS